MSRASPIRILRAVATDWLSVADIEAKTGMSRFCIAPWLRMLVDARIVDVATDRGCRSMGHKPHVYKARDPKGWAA